MGSTKAWVAAGLFAAALALSGQTDAQTFTRCVNGAAVSTGCYNYGAVLVNPDGTPATISGGGGSGGTVTQGPAGTAPWLATIYQGGNALSATNPIFTQLTAGSAVIGSVTQSGGPWTISGTVTANFGTLNGAALDTSVQSVKTTLGSPFQAGGSIGNTAFGISGSLPAGTNSIGTVGLNAGTNAIGSITNTAFALNAGSANIGSITNITGTVSLPTGAATSALQSNVQSAPGTGASTAVGVQGVSGGVAVPISGAVNQGSPNVGGGQAWQSFISGSGGFSNGAVFTFSRIPSVAASTNLTQAKGGGGRVNKIVACNTTTTSYRIKFYNALSANVTVGTTTPMFTRPIPAAASAGGLNCASWDNADIGWGFSTAISYAITAGPLDTDTTAPAAGAITDLSVELQ